MTDKPCPAVDKVTISRITATYRCSLPAGHPGMHDHRATAGGSVHKWRR